MHAYCVVSDFGTLPEESVFMSGFFCRCILCNKEGDYEQGEPLGVGNNVLEKF